jgi:hypothetical protein
MRLKLASYVGVYLLFLHVDLCVRVRRVRDARFAHARARALDDSLSFACLRFVRARCTHVRAMHYRRNPVCMLHALSHIYTTLNREARFIE